MDAADEWRLPANMTARKQAAKDRRRVVEARKRRSLREQGHRKLQDFADAASDERYNAARAQWLALIKERRN